MSTGPTPTPAPDPLNWLQRQANAAGAGLAYAAHRVGGAIESILPAVEAEGNALFKEEVPAVKSYVLTFLQRNATEFGQKSAAAVIALAETEAPALIPFGPSAESAIVAEYGRLIAVLEEELRTNTAPAPAVKP